MKLAVLRIFLAVAEEGSVTRAATRLNTVQSNVTTRIRQLEASLQTPLFDRVNRRLVITPAGQLLVDYAQRLLALADEAEQAVRSFETPRGRLRLGSMETTAASRLPAQLARFRRHYPDVALTLSTAPARRLLQDLLQHQLDAVLVTAPVKHPDLATRPVIREQLVLVTAAGAHPPASHTRSGAAEPAPLLTYGEGCNYRQRLLEWFQHSGLPHGPIHEFGSFEAIIGCAAAGMGVSLLPRAVLDAHLQVGSVAAHPTPLHISQVTTVLVWHRARSRDPTREAFADLLCEGLESV